MFTFVQNDMSFKFNPQKRIEDFNGKHESLMTLYIRDVLAVKSENCYILGVDGEYAFAPFTI